jgi:ATP-binding cassette subfamily B protein
VTAIGINRETIRKAISAVGVVRPFFRQHRWRIFAGFLALVGVNGLQLTIPRIIRQAVDGLQQGTVTQSDLLHHGITVMWISLAIGACRFGWRYLILGFSRILEVKLRDAMFAHLLTLDRPFFQKKPPGEIMALASNDLAAVQMACGMGLIAFSDALFMSMATLGFMAYIHPGLTLLTVLPMPLLAVLTSYLSARIHRRFKKVQEQFSRLTEFTRDTLASIRLIKAYTQEKDRLARFNGLGQSYVRDNLRLALVQGTMFPVSGMVANVSMLLVLFFGGRLTIHGAITIGDFAAFISYLFMLTWPIMALGWVANLFQLGVTSLHRIKAVLDAVPKLTEPPYPLPLPVVHHGFALRHLTFGYAPGLEPALQDLSLTIGPGVLGVVGRTGSGKSTLCQLLARLYPVPEATLFMENQDVNLLPLAGVRSQIAYLPQEVLVFSDTVAANIAMGKPDASPAEIETAARAAAIHDEILAMQNGYQTRIGEKGVTLSGGQRQRLALARTLLLDRPILILDDGLSAVDTQTEHDIIANLRPFLAKKICVIVSHRLQALADADRLVVLAEGRVAEDGTHAQLLAQGGLYAAIYEHQGLQERCN